MSVVLPRLNGARRQLLLPVVLPQLGMLPVATSPYVAF